MDTQTLSRVKIDLIKVLYLLLPFILSFYFLFPDAVFAQSKANIVLPGGQKPKFKLVKTNSTDYISIKDFRANFLPEFTIKDKYMLVKGENAVLAAPSSFYLCSIMDNEKYIAQMSSPAYEMDGELYIPYNNIVEYLQVLNIYTTIELEDNVLLKKVEDEAESIAKIEDFEIAKSDKDIEIEYFREENFSNALPIDIVTGGEINQNTIINTETDSQISRKSITNIIKEAANTAKSGFSALKPSNNVIYLEPTKTAPDIIKKKKIEQDDNLPPNLYIVPKGLFRKNIDKIKDKQ